MEMIYSSNSVKYYCHNTVHMCIVYDAYNVQYYEMPITQGLTL
jgi:hypothetical protein